MRVLLLKLPQEQVKDILLLLKVRWSDLIPFCAEDATEALHIINREQPHLVILHLPERSNGVSPEECFELIGRIHTSSALPLIVLGRDHDLTDRVRALEMGADDWVSAGFSPMEFIAKVGAILRRCRPGRPEVASFLNGTLSIDYAGRRVFVRGKPVRLTPIQFKILCHLAENEGRVCTNTEILERIWGPDGRDARELLKLNIYRLRSRLKPDPADPEIIFNERGAGYVMRTPDPGRNGTPCSVSSTRTTERSESPADATVSSSTGPGGRSHRRC